MVSLGIMTKTKTKIMNRSVLQKILVCIFFLYVYLQNRLLASLGTSPSSTNVDGIVDKHRVFGGNIYIQHTKVLGETVKPFFMGNDTAARKYLKDHPSNGLKIYVHKIPLGVRMSNRLASVWKHGDTTTNVTCILQKKNSSRTFAIGQKLSAILKITQSDLSIRQQGSTITMMLCWLDSLQTIVDHLGHSILLRL